MVVVIAVITVVVSSRKACNRRQLESVAIVKLQDIVVYWFTLYSHLFGVDTRCPLASKWLEKCVTLLSES